MSVAGTLYEETVKFGHAKLLSAQTASSVVFLTFITPFTSEFNTYHFDIVNLTHNSAGQFLCCQFTNNAGASWLNSWWWTNSYVCSHSNVFGNEGSPLTAGSVSDVIRLTGNGYAGYPNTGEVIIHCAPGKAMQMQSHMSINQVSYGQMQMIAGSAADAGTNGVRFFFYNGTPIVSGTIRMYGLRSGLI